MMNMVIDDETAARICQTTRRENEAM